VVALGGRIRYLTVMSTSRPQGASPLWFYGMLGAYVACSAFLGLHGSSLDMYAAHFHGLELPLLGYPKGIRSDEWLAHTPALLHQLLYADPLSVESGVVGPNRALLLLNIPSSSLTTFFRPQFWPFFAFSPERAFSIYWQFKTLLLAGGVFAILFLITELTAISAVLALFFYFSPHTQWAFSWPSLLPEMIGSACLATVLMCLALSSRNVVVIVSAAVAAGLFAVNFALCVYPPHQIALAWTAIVIFAWWVISRWAQIWEQPFRRWRAVALVLAILVACIGMGLFYQEAKDAIVAATNTIYPGLRRVSGGGRSIYLYASHFLDFWKTENNIPAPWANIVEATGYLWFGPLTVVLARRLDAGPYRSAYFTLLGIFSVLSLWIFFPIPAWAGRPFGLDLADPGRMVPAMGLLNTLMLGAFLRGYTSKSVSLNMTITMAAVLCCVLLLVLLYVKGRFGLAVGLREIAASSLFAALVFGFIIGRFHVALAIALIVPLAVTTGLVNPIGRGLNVILHSKLQEFLDEHSELRRKRWLVFSDLVGPNYVSAHGVDVFNSLRVVPDLATLGKLDPQGKYLSVYNSASYLIAQGQNSSKSTVFENIQQAGVLQLWISPQDPALRQIGIGVLAFREKPPDDWVAGLKPVGSGPVDTFWIFQIP
jgi:hypothetical protein